MISLLFVLFFLSLTDAGCYQRRLCCPGRNNSCKAVDDGINHLPTASPLRELYRTHQSEHHKHRSHFRHQSTQHPTPRPFGTYHTPYYEASGEGYDLIFPEVYKDESHEKIGKLVLPDVIELEGSGAETIYDRYGPQDDNAPAKLVDSRISSTLPPPKTTSAKKIHHLIFGMPEGPDYPPEEELRYHPKPKHLLIRYSILSQYLPLTVSTTPSSDYRENARFMYLESGSVDCYCDESCVALGDCCSDYTFVCPPRDCIVDEWSSWQECQPDKGTCGTGEQQRTRRVREQPERGGVECPPLKEMRTCFKKCIKKKALGELTTVALLLDYRYNTTRSKVIKDNVYWDLPEVYKKYKQALYYCVKYEIGWVNRNCWNKQITKRIFRGNIICVECQPEAQLHRSNGRCASDLDDGDQGFWKMIGPKSCNGIWTRISRTDDCRCSNEFPELDPFLLV